jgi:hypothetical protein
MHRFAGQLRVRPLIVRRLSNHIGPMGSRFNTPDMGEK